MEPLELQLIIDNTGEKRNIIKKTNSTATAVPAEVLGGKKRPGRRLWEARNNVPFSHLHPPSAVLSASH